MESLKLFKYRAIYASYIQVDHAKVSHNLHGSNVVVITTVWNDDSGATLSYHEFQSTYGKDHFTQTIGEKSPYIARGTKDGDSAAIE